MINPLVSIIIPVYNGSNYLREAIDSALAQTYQYCEILVIDDGSTDDTAQIALSYGEQVRYFYKKNGGVASALNFGIQQMRGDYFSWLSHDDLYYPEKISIQIKSLREDGDMTKLVFGDFEVLNQETGEREAHILRQHAQSDRITNSVYPVMQHMISGCVLLIHRSHFERVGLFDETLRYVQDYDMWFRLFRNVNSIYINQVLQVVRLHGKELSKTECDPMKAEEINFWRSVFGKLSEKEIVEMYGSVLLYLLEFRTRLSSYDCVSEKLDRQIKNEIARRNVRLEIKKITADLPVYIFGAGMYGKIFYWFIQQCGIETAGFIDNNLAKHGKAIVDDAICISYEDAFKKRNSIFVVVAMYEFDAACRQLKEAQFPQFTSIQKIYELFAKET